MTRSENSLENLMEEAERLGKEQKEVDERNRKRRAKGRPPLPDIQEMKDLEISRRKYRTGDRTTVDAVDALKLFEIRKAQMADGSSNPEDIDDEAKLLKGAQIGATFSPPPPISDEHTEAAVLAAELARRVQDLKNGRIDHAGNWSETGQQLEGGDATRLAEKPHAPDAPQNETSADDTWRQDSPDSPDAPEAPAKKGGKGKKGKSTVTSTEAFDAFVKDLYTRLGTSFEALERTLSDLQGRVAEIVTATTPAYPASDAIPDGGADAFAALLEQKTPVVFNVGGTQMTFDAICVFHEKPCITVVSKIGSAKITPKPGAQLRLTYEADGRTYVNDPVTYLGTRFDLPMFGLSFVGFIRDEEAGQIDDEAGLSAEAPAEEAGA